jgi:hypothetical protein
MMRKQYLALLLSLTMLEQAACTTAAVAQPTASQVPLVETPACTEETVFPIITDVLPSPAQPGSEITITATGGYIQDSCGGINESARSFQLYLDDELVGDLSCYVNHCEAKINLQGSIESKLHCLSTQPGVCEFQFQVENNTSSNENISHCDWETQIIGTWYGKLDEDTLITLKFSNGGNAEIEKLYVPRQDRHYSSGTYRCLENGNISYSFSAFGGYNDIIAYESEIQLSGNELTIHFMDKKLNLERSK